MNWTLVKSFVDSSSKQCVQWDMCVKEIERERNRKVEKNIN